MPNTANAAAKTIISSGTRASQAKTVPSHPGNRDPMRPKNRLPAKIYGPADNQQNLGLRA